MIIVCSKADLQRSMNIAMRAIPARSTMPILECVLIDATADKINFIANDMELGVETMVMGSILERGKVALDAKILNDIIRKLPDGDVTIKTDESFMTYINCGKAKFHIPGQEGDDFVFLPLTERREALPLSQFQLKEMIRQTIFCTAVNENNSLMMGELLEVRDNMMRIASLDGHRIAIRNHELSTPFPDTKVVIPGKTLTELGKILSTEVSDLMNLYFEKNLVVFEMGDTLMVSRLMEGEYYRIDQMLPKDFETKLVINRKEFLECIDRSSLLVKEGDKRPLIMDIVDDQIDIRIESAMGSMNEQIEAHKDGIDMIIAFNPKFLMDALRAISEEEVTIYFSNPKAPCVLQDEEKTYTYLILPINISSNQY